MHGREEGGGFGHVGSQRCICKCYSSPLMSLTAAPSADCRCGPVPCRHMRAVHLYSPLPTPSLSSRRACRYMYMYMDMYITALYRHTVPSSRHGQEAKSCPTDDPLSVDDDRWAMQTRTTKVIDGGVQPEPVCHFRYTSIRLANVQTNHNYVIKNLSGWIR